MKKIFKYELDFEEMQTIEIPSENILTAKGQYGKIVIYALIDTDIPPIEYKFLMVGTGHQIGYDTNNFKFLDTVKLANGMYMMHVFYAISL